MKILTTPAPMDNNEFSARLITLINSVLPEYTLEIDHLLDLDLKQITLDVMRHRPAMGDDDTTEESMTWWMYEFTISCLMYAKWLNPLAEFYLRRAESALRLSR